MGTDETMTSQAERFDELRGDIRSIIAKIDGLALIYVLRETFEPWRQSVEKRIDNLEESAKNDKQWENDEHVKLAQQVVESERRIIEKIDGNSKLSMGMKLTMIIAACGWLFGVLEFILNYIVHH